MPMPPSVTREVLADGSVRLSAGSCNFSYQRLKPGVLLLSIIGDDRGQFGPATVDETAAEFTRTTQPLKLFVDTRRATGPTREVMETWTEWFAANRQRLDQVVILVSPESKLLHLTVSIAQHLSRTGGLIRICGTPDEFLAAIGKAVPDCDSRRLPQL
jgi:hypothetical protein